MAGSKVQTDIRLMNIYRKGHDLTAQPSRGTKRRRDKEQTTTGHNDTAEKSDMPKKKERKNYYRGTVLGRSEENKWARVPESFNYSRLSLSRLRLSGKTAYLEVKIWSLF